MDNNKRGLILHSLELQDVLGSKRCSSVHPGNILEVLNMIIRVLFDKKVEYILIWNLGITFMLAPFFRFFGKKVIYTKHEPGSLKSRIKKTNRIMLSLIQHFLVEHYSKSYSELIVFNRTKGLEKNEVYLPLIFKSKFISTNSSGLNRLVYLGGKLETRGHSILKKFRNEIFSSSFEVVFFPEDFEDTSELSKQKLLQEGRTIIWNFFTVPYNQSGVTLDALRYGVPVILSHHDNQLTDNSLTYNADSLLKNMSNLNTEIEKVFVDYDKHKSDIRKQTATIEAHIHRAWRQYFDIN